MIRTLKIEEEPLIKINWGRLFNYFKALLFLIWRIIIEVIKTIIKMLTFIVLLIYKSYMKLRKFCISKIRGFWIVLLLILFIVISINVYRKYVFIQTQKNQEYNRLKDIKNGQIEFLLKDRNKMKLKIIDLEDKLTYQQQRQQIVATGWEKVKVLPEEVKGVIAKYSEIYKVNRPLIECIVANESGGRYNAIGDSGAAIGVAQYHLATFLGHRRNMGLPQEDLRTNVDASIQAMCWSISNGGIGNWTARYKCV